MTVLKEYESKLDSRSRITMRKPEERERLQTGRFVPIRRGLILKFAIFLGVPEIENFWNDLSERKLAGNDHRLIVLSCPKMK